MNMPKMMGSKTEKVETRFHTVVVSPDPQEDNGNNGYWRATYRQGTGYNSNSVMFDLMLLSPRQRSTRLPVGGTVMGMFDTIVHNRTDICCPNGHVLKDLQTKDFDCNLDTYTLDAEGILHGPSRRQGPHPLYHAAFPRADVLVGDHEVEGLGRCRECDVYAEFRFVFVTGKLVSVTRIENEDT